MFVEENGERRRYKPRLANIYADLLTDDETLVIDPAVARSELKTGYRNFALANYMRSFGNLAHPPDLSLGVYFHQCAISATSGLFLANGGRTKNGPVAITMRRAISHFVSGYQVRAEWAAAFSP